MPDLELPWLRATVALLSTVTVFLICILFMGCNIKTICKCLRGLTRNCADEKRLEENNPLMSIAEEVSKNPLYELICKRCFGPDVIKHLTPIGRAPQAIAEDSSGNAFEFVSPKPVSPTELVHSQVSQIPEVKVIKETKPPKASCSHDIEPALLNELKQKKPPKGYHFQIYVKELGMPEFKKDNEEKFIQMRYAEAAEVRIGKRRFDILSAQNRLVSFNPNKKNLDDENNESLCSLPFDTADTKEMTCDVTAEDDVTDKDEVIEILGEDKGKEKIPSREAD